MPEFTNPFTGNVPERKLSPRELVRALRMNLAAEEDAASLYEAHADATDSALARAVLQDIANEERVHAGEFQRLISLLLDDEEALLAEGAAEVDEIAAELAGEPPAAASAEDDRQPTVGDLTEGSA